MGGPEWNPADEDEHAECTREIHRLRDMIGAGTAAGYEESMASKDAEIERLWAEWVFLRDELRVAGTREARDNVLEQLEAQLQVERDGNTRLTEALRDMTERREAWKESCDKWSAYAIATGSRRSKLWEEVYPAEARLRELGEIK